MCRPGLPNFFSSGWHLHQSLRDRKSGGQCASPRRSTGNSLSELGTNYIAGLLKHARASCLFSTPTINGYKRYRPYSLAPDRAHLGARSQGRHAPRRYCRGWAIRATRIENRVGEPAANPYLYMASQVLTGLAGIKGRMSRTHSLRHPL